MPDFSKLWELISPYFTIGVDIIIVAFLIYQAYRIFTRSRVVPVVFGLGILLLLASSSQWFQLDTIAWIFENLSSYLIIGMIVVLQPELRKIFYKMGEVGFFQGLFSNISAVPVEDVSQALLILAEDKTGAIIILVNKVGLKPLSDGGIQLQAKVSRELIQAIFFKDNPLHDGAVIIEGDTILSAAAYLPLSNSNQLKRTHGARHRAGLGISEESDALSLIVSEEKGKISVAFQGELKEGVDAITLKSLLVAFNNNKLAQEWEIVFGSGSKK